LAEGVSERSAENAEVSAEGAEEHEVARDPVELGQDRADIEGPFGRLEVRELLDSLDVGELAVEAAKVVSAVLEADGLAVVEVLGELLGAAVHVANVRDGVLHDLAVDL